MLFFKKKSNKAEYTSAVLLCAGSGARMNGCVEDKLLFELCGEPVVAKTIKAFEKAKTINEIIIVTKEEKIKKYHEIINKFKFKKVSKIVIGGDKRQESALNGAYKTNEKSKFICISDGARPFVKSEDIDLVNKKAYSVGAAALGVCQKDTIKQINSKGNIIKTLDRNKIISIQTPQTFNKKDYITYALAVKSIKKEFTDDCMIFEYFKKPVATVLGSYSNIKITTNDDIALAKKILEELK